MADAYRRGVDERSAAATIRARGAVGSAAATSPALAEVSARDFSAALAEECFGPFALVVRYERESQVLRALEHVPGSLTATILTAGERDRELPLARQSLSERAGRVLFDGYPTGVAVAWAQHHGGPWPATNSLHTSVGMTAMRRFLRPIAWQGGTEPRASGGASGRPRRGPDPHRRRHCAAGGGGEDLNGRACALSRAKERASVRGSVGPTA